MIMLPFHVNLPQLCRPLNVLHFLVCYRPHNYQMLHPEPRWESLHVTCVLGAVYKHDKSLYNYKYCLVFLALFTTFMIDFRKHSHKDTG